MQTVMLGFVNEPKYWFIKRNHHMLIVHKGNKKHLVFTKLYKHG